jgi:hypothetical protein
MIVWETRIIDSFTRRPLLADAHVIISTTISVNRHVQNFIEIRLMLSIQTDDLSVPIVFIYWILCKERPAKQLFFLVYFMRRVRASAKSDY